jgi:asparagine synthase (glutamine-hydrolysing)
MCGIVGVLAFQGVDVNLAQFGIEKARDTMAHRGPDGAGLWLSADGRVALGHRRLSIIDLSAAATQPMCNEDGTLWTAFNGEIYNHAEIRAELERVGKHRWRTDHSDTEVILHAFEEWGIACLEKFRGMFAIALWDARARELWLIRDRLGVKPLYYSVQRGWLTFASEIKALLNFPGQRRAVNEEALIHYLSFLTTPAPDTLFEGIKKLPCGTWLRIREDGSIQECRYWDVWDHVRPLRGCSEAELGESIRHELRTAVRLRLVSDVPVGVFLSGGIDSSTNAALFSQEATGSVKAFTIGYDGAYATYPSELPYARLMARAVGAEYHERLLKLDDLLSFLPEMVRLQDEPIADPVCVPVYYVSKLAREHGVTVCQVGEGADELFFGYPWWQRLLRLQCYDDLPVPRTLKKAGLAALRAMGKENSSYYEWLRRGSVGQPIFWGGAEAFTQAQKERLLSPRLRRQFAGRTSWEALEPIYTRFLERAWETSPLNWMTYLDLNLRLPELLLMRVDKMSMAVGLEGRVPFLDHKFVELAMSIPPAIKAHRGVPKYILKQAVHDLIPADIINRPKQGFGVPVCEWFLGRLGDKARTELDSFCRQTDFLDRAAVLRLLEQARASQVWYLLNFALWWKEYIA